MVSAISRCDIRSASVSKSKECEEEILNFFYPAHFPPFWSRFSANLLYFARDQSQYWLFIRAVQVYTLYAVVCTPEYHINDIRFFSHAPNQQTDGSIQWQKTAEKKSRQTPTMDACKIYLIRFKILRGQPNTVIDYSFIYHWIQMAATYMA